MSRAIEDKHIDCLCLQIYDLRRTFDTCNVKFVQEIWYRSCVRKKGVHISLILCEEHKPTLLLLGNLSGNMLFCATNPLLTELLLLHELLLLLNNLLLLLLNNPLLLRLLLRLPLHFRLSDPHRRKLTLNEPLVT